jgi:hypothetical protein
MAGFEPAASCSQSRRDTGLRYIPSIVVIGNAKVAFLSMNANNFKEKYLLFQLLFKYNYLIKFKHIVAQ